MGFAAALLFVCLGISSRGNLQWAWGGWFCLFVYAICGVFLVFFFVFLLTATKALLTQWSVGQSSWTHLLASDEKVVPPCFSISVCNFSFLFFTEAPLLFLLILFQRISGGEVIYFFFLSFFFIFLLTRLPGDMSKVTHFLTELARTPKHQLCCKRGNKKEGKGGQGRLFH